MELRHLRYFVAAAEEEHFARAAERLCITRPAVSQIVSDLESELGTQLFERTAHRVKLTAAGATLLECARRVLVDLGHAVELTKRVGNGKAGVLNIGYGSLTLLHPIFRAAIKQVHAEYPDIALSLREITSRNQLEAVRSGALHAGFTHTAAPDTRNQKRKSTTANSPFENSVEFDRLTIQAGRIAVAVPRTHRLASRRSVRLTDLVDEHFIDVPASSISPRTGRLGAACMEAGLEAHVVQEVTNIVTQINLISVGVGVGIGILLPGLTYPSSIRVIPITGITYTTKFQLLWLRQRSLEPVLAQFIEIVRRLSKLRHSSDTIAAIGELPVSPVY